MRICPSRRVVRSKGDTYTVALQLAMAKRTPVMRHGLTIMPFMFAMTACLTIGISIASRSSWHRKASLVYNRIVCTTWRDIMPRTTVKTNELKRGDWVTLRNGWHARLEDNRKGNIRMCTVFGLYTEMGSVYSHNMVCQLDPTTDIAMGIVGKIIAYVEHTPAQVKLRRLTG